MACSGASLGLVGWVYFKATENQTPIRLDIEGPQYWMDQTSNRNFFSGLLDGARARNQKIGIYTSASQWGPIMGSTTAGSAYPLWYGA